ncbi:MAG: quinolinate synthase NadA, partial [Microbacterium sp.]
MTAITLQPRPADASVDHAIQAIVAGASTAETCNTDLAQGPWTFDDRPGYGPGSSMGDVIPTGSPRQGELPQAYRDASPEELDARIVAAKAALGERVVVLGHFYQREEVVRHADYVGDSFQLANAALEHPHA